MVFGIGPFSFSFLDMTSEKGRMHLPVSDRQIKITMFFPLLIYDVIYIHQWHKCCQNADANVRGEGKEKPYARLDSPALGQPATRNPLQPISQSINQVSFPLTVQLNSRGGQKPPEKKNNNYASHLLIISPHLISSHLFRVLVSRQH